MRMLLATPSLAALVALAACAPAPYEQVQGGVGFGDYSDYMSRRSAEAAASAGAGLVAQQPIVPPPVDPNAPPSSTELAAAGISGAAALPQAPVPAPMPVPQPGITPQAAAPAPLPAPNPTPAPVPAGASKPSAISDEQDFAAVAARESIESDKARIEQNRAQYVQVQPGALPERPAGDSSVIVQYAINAQNRLGQSVYSRTGLSLSSHERACSRYSSPEAAQEAFLKSGGPQRDPKNLDPDGDGFACAWDPTPFQTVRN